MTSMECSLRPMNCEVNQLSMPDGSSMFMQGETCVIAGVYGPVEAKMQKMMYDRASVEVVFSPIKGPPSIEDRTKESYIKETCESSIITMLHPSTAISIDVQEMQDAGGLLACAINCACVALINASLSMKYTIAAVSCMIEKETGRLLLDPEESQLHKAKASFTFAFDSIKKDLVCCRTTGRFSEQDFFYALDKCKEASQHVFHFYREIVKKFSVLSTIIWLTGIFSSNALVLYIRCHHQPRHIHLNWMPPTPELPSPNTIDPPSKEFLQMTIKL